MTNLETNWWGKKEDIKIRASQFLSDSLDEFLTSTSSIDEIGSLLKLSVGIEIFLKKYLENKFEGIINKKLFGSTLRDIEKNIDSNETRESKREILESEMSKLDSDPNRTISFSIAISLLPYYYEIPESIISDLFDLKDYRNGLFHWEAKSSQQHKLSKQSLRLFNWIFNFLENEHNLKLGKELVDLDPFFEKRRKLSELLEVVDEEIKFNFLRRLYFYQQKLNYYSMVKYNLSWLKRGIHTNHILVNLQCPCCGFEKCEITKSGHIKDGKWIEEHYWADCKKCGFDISDTEFEIFKSESSQTLKELYDEHS